MELENQTDDDDFDAAFNKVTGLEQQAKRVPADTDTREGDATPEPEKEPVELVAPEAPESQAEPEDELAGMPPKVRAMLEEVETLRKAAALVPSLEHRLRQAEGRLGDLNGRIPKPQPPAPPKMEKWDRVRQDLPEVAEGLEEFFSHHSPKKADEPAEGKPQSQEVMTPVLDEEYPDWGQTVQSNDFQLWLGAQPPDYRAKVHSTDSEAVFLSALVKFSKHQSAAKAAAKADAAKAAAAKQAQVRQARAASAAVPQGSGRRAPIEQDEDDAFAAAFRRTRQGG